MHFFLACVRPTIPTFVGSSDQSWMVTTYKVEKGYAKISICKYLYLSIGIICGAITFEQQFFGEKQKQNKTTLEIEWCTLACVRPTILLLTATAIISIRNRGCFYKENPYAPALEYVRTQHACMHNDDDTETSITSTTTTTHNARAQSANKKSRLLSTSYRTHTQTDRPQALKVMRIYVCVCVCCPVARNDTNVSNNPFFLWIMLPLSFWVTR